MSQPDPASPLQLDIARAIARIRFNRPDSLNAINIGMAQAFQDAIATIAATPGVRAVLLCGQGKAFMAGGDLAELSLDSATTAARIIEPLHAGLQIMAALPVPVVASVHGAIAGAGLSMMLAADLAIAADDSIFNMAYARIGASPDGSGSWHLPRVVGLRKAMEIALLSESFDAQEALRLSVVNRVVPASDLLAETDKLMRRLADGPTASFGHIKSLLREAQTRDLATQLDAERAAFEACAATEDFHEGVTAFLQKHRPAYHGR